MSKLILESDTGAKFSINPESGISVDKDIVPADINGDATQKFKVADATAANEALSKGQLLAEIQNIDGSGSGLDADKLDGLDSSAFAKLNGDSNQRFKIADAVNPDEALAKGQFNQTFYVDATNGDDNNDGSSANPFASIQKAVDSTPISGFVNINIVSDYTGTFNAHAKNLKIVISSGKTLTIEKGTRCIISGTNTLILNEGSIIVDNGDGSGINGDNYAGFFVQNSEISNYSSIPTNLSIINFGNTNPITIDKYRALFGSRTYGTNQNIQMNLNIYNSHCKDNFTIDGALMQLRNGTGSFRWNNFGNDSSFAVVDSDGNSVDVATKIGGIIKDSNGVPRNVISNIIL